MRNKLFNLFFLFVLCSNLFAQDPVFSQYYANGIYINPAMNAANGITKASTQYRSQWAGKSYRYDTYNASVELPIKNSNSSLGLFALGDETRSNLLHHTAFSLVYAYKFKIKEGLIVQTALQAGMGQNRLSSDLIFEDQLSLEGPTAQRSAENLADENLLYPDFSSGVTVMARKFYFGAAVHHLNRPNQAFRSNDSRRLERKYTLNGGAKLSNDKLGKIDQFYSPNFIIQLQGESSTVSIGNYFKYHGFTAGLWYRWNEAIVTGVGLELDNFKIAYSTDFSVGNHPNSALSHEISLTVVFPGKSKSKNLPHHKEWLTYCPTF